MHMRENQVTSLNQSTIVAFKLKVQSKVKNVTLYLFQRAPKVAHNILRYRMSLIKKDGSYQNHYLCPQGGDIHESVLGM